MIFILNILCFSDPLDTLWTKTYGGTDNESCYEVQQINSGEYVAVGHTRSYGIGNKDIYLVKTDSLGDTLWTRTFGSIFNDGGGSIRETEDSNLILCYTTAYESGNPDIHIRKISMAGDTLWHKVYGSPIGEACYEIEKTFSAGYIIVGYTWGGVYIVKTDSLGDTLWTGVYGGNDRDVGHTICRTRDSCYVIAGYSKSYGAGGADVYLFKIDGQGTMLWSQTFGGNEDDIAYDITQTPDNGFLIVGHTSSFGPMTPEYRNLYLIRTNSAGDSIWTRVIGGDDHDDGYAISMMADSNYLVVGCTGSYGSGLIDLWMLKIDQNGDTAWTSTLGGTNYDRGHSIMHTQDNGYIIGGETVSFGAGGYDMWVIKTGQEMGIIEQITNLNFRNFELTANPNPFSQMTDIRLQMTDPFGEDSRTKNQDQGKSYAIKNGIDYSNKNKDYGDNNSLRIYNAAGRTIKSFSVPSAYCLVPTVVCWHGRDDQNRKQPSGVYFVAFKTNDSRIVEKLIRIE